MRDGYSATCDQPHGGRIRNAARDVPRCQGRADRARQSKEVGGILEGPRGIHRGAGSVRFRYIVHTVHEKLETNARCHGSSFWDYGPGISFGNTNFTNRKRRGGSRDSTIPHAAVQRHVPNDQLLVFNVKEGWDPLYRFLGKDVPVAEDDDGSGSKLIPFPNVNESQDLKRATTMMKVVSYGWIPTVVVGSYTIRLVLRGRRPAATQ